MVKQFSRCEILLKNGRTIIQFIKYYLIDISSVQYPGLVRPGWDLKLLLSIISDSNGKSWFPTQEQFYKLLFKSNFKHFMKEYILYVTRNKETIIEHDNVRKILGFLNLLRSINLSLIGPNKFSPNTSCFGMAFNQLGSD